MYELRYLLITVPWLVGRRIRRVLGSTLVWEVSVSADDLSFAALAGGSPSDSK